MGPRQTSVPDRLATYAVVIGGVVGVVHLLGGVAAAGGDAHRIVTELLSRLGVALAFFAGGCAVAWIASRAAGATSRVNDLSRQVSETAADEMTTAREIVDRLGAIELALQAMKSKRPASPVADEIPEPTPDPVLTAAVGSSHSANNGTEDRIVALLEEIREVALMNDEQRQLCLKQHLEGRRKAALDQVYLCFRAGRWAAADQKLATLEHQFPADPAVKQARGEFHRQRAAAETESFLQAEQRVRDLAQVQSWERAIATANEFVNNFPANVDGRHLLTQIHRDFEGFRDSAFQRLYEQVQANVDRRVWRAALVDAQRLLEEFPNHSRANRIRQQLKTIRDNAQIEERQEHEIRIQLLVKGRRFAEAVELAEEVVRRFPDSPQADALEARLPQLRELAEHGEVGAEGG